MIQILNLRAETSKGDINGELHLTLKKNMTLAGFIPAMLQPSLALEIFSLRSYLRIPRIMVKDDQRLVAPVMEGMETGLFVEDGDDLVHDARTESGELILNGRKVMLR